MKNFESPSFSKKVILFFTSLLFTPIVLPSHVDASWFGKYKSQRQAREACFEWKEKAVSKEFKLYVWVRDYKIGDVISKERKRRCDHESITKQYLGTEQIELERQNLRRYNQKGMKYLPEKYFKREKIKHFRY